MWISFRVWLHFKTHKAHIMSIHLWMISMLSIQVLCHVVDLKHGFVTSLENVLFTLENIGSGTRVKITWNYFPCQTSRKFLQLTRHFCTFAEIKTCLLRKSWNISPDRSKFHQICLVCLVTFGLSALPRSTQGKNFHRLCARFGAVIIVDFYIDDFNLAVAPSTQFVYL